MLDATIGQNAVNQARSFAEALPLTGLVLTKLDGTARGGVIVSVVDELEALPIKFAGTGEKPGDFAPFSAEQFARALFEEEEAREPSAAASCRGGGGAGIPGVPPRAGRTGVHGPGPRNPRTRQPPGSRRRRAGAPAAWRRWFGG